MYTYQNCQEIELKYCTNELICIQYKYMNVFAPTIMHPFLEHLDLEFQNKDA